MNLVKRFLDAVIISFCTYLKMMIYYHISSSFGNPGPGRDPGLHPGHGVDPGPSFNPSSGLILVTALFPVPVLAKKAVLVKP